MSRTHKLRAVAVCLAAVTGLSACASIPENSDIKVVKPVDEGNVGIPAPPPPPNVDSFALVRRFVDAAASPDNNYGAARLHLTPETRKAWSPPPGVVIVDELDTIPVLAPPGTPEHVRYVSLQADKVGTLEPDQSFRPKSGEYEATVRVQRQPNGQWRIATPPPGLVVSRAAFTNSYMPVPVYFLDRERNGVVPDLRYVVAQPASALPARVVDLLMAGPSRGFRTAMHTALPPGVETKTNVSEAEDGALVVNLSGLHDSARHERRLIAAQVVLSLQGVSNARVRLLLDGAPLLPQEHELRPADVAAYENNNVVPPDAPGLAIVDERLRILDEQAAPVPGPAGSGEYDVVRAAQSADGRQLSAVTRQPTGGVGLRAGRYGKPLPETAVSGVNLSTPTWRGNSEVWTVIDGRDIVRVLDNGEGTWTPQRLNSAEFSGGRPITDLRVSRDGTRVAGVVDGRIVVAGISEAGGRVSFQRPTVLTGSPVDSSITGIEWLSEDSLVAITSSGRTPVVEVTVDGFKWSPYASSNLVQPLTTVAVAPNRKVVVADNSGLWHATGKDDLWRLMQAPIGGGSIPLYPG